MYQVQVFAKPMKESHEGFFSSSFLPLLFIFCGVALHGLLWLLTLSIKKKRSGVQSFLSQICKALFVWPRCQETLTSLVLNKREGQPRRINLIMFIVHVTEEVLNM